jgi:ABC-2 type transport system permease protein
VIKWLNSYRLMVQWQALRLKPVLPLFVVVQIFTGVGMVIGLGYLMPEIDPGSATFLATGAPTMTLVTLGLVGVPQMVAQAKAQGAFDYVWSLPVPRMAFLAADLTIWLLCVLPGVILALFVGSQRYDFTLQISPLVVPALLLVGLTATAVGYAIAHLSPKPELVVVITNFIIFCLFLFSPINFPVERLPGWLAELHRFLPVKYAADVVRGTLAKGYSDGLESGFTVLGVWFVVAFGITYAVVTRRR